MSECFMWVKKGRFDALVRNVLQDLSFVYPEIHYGVLIPFQTFLNSEEPEPHGMLPEGIEEVPPRYAIEWINRWMLRRSDFVVAYITHSWGGAAKFVAQAKRQGKTVINLAQLEHRSVEGPIL